MDESIKSLLNLPDDVYNKQQKTIEAIAEVSKQQLLSLLSKEIKDVPDDLSYIVPLVIVKRYRRLGNEGLASYSQSEQSKTYLQVSDFDEFMTAIEKANDNANTTRPTTWFL